MEFPDPKYRDICSRETVASSKKGFFVPFATAVIERVGTDWISNVFAREYSDEDKIRICCTDKGVWNTIQEVLANIKPVFREKSHAASRESALEGDKAFKEKNYKRAAILYSQSVIKAPKGDTKNGASLSSAYKSRADAYYQLERYRECLNDLLMSLREGIPNHVKYKIYHQMGECHMQLEDVTNATVSLQVALKMVEQEISATSAKSGKEKRGKSEVESLKKEKSEIQNLLSVLSKSKGIGKAIAMPKESHTKGSIPEVTGSINEKYPSASSLLTIKQSVQAGRFAVAADNIGTGDTIVVEEPYASCLIPEMFSSHCHHCYSRLDYAVPCDTCAGVAFCGIKCRDIALSTYHKHECPFLGLFIGSGMSVLSFLSLRMVTQERLDFFKALHNKVRLLGKGETGTEQCPPMEFTERERAYIGIYNLVTHSTTRPSVDYFTRTLMAVFLVKCLKKTDFFGDGKKTEELSEDEVLTASVILHHLQVLQFNAHEIYETQVYSPGKVKGSKSVYIGVGIYPTVALFNHECSPGVTRYFHGRNIVIRAVRPIKRGHPIAENYGPTFTKRSLSERNRELTSRYWFKCECDACYENWPVMDDLTPDTFRLRCKTMDCTGLLPLPLSMEKSQMDKTCPRCFKKIHLGEVVERLSHVESLFHEGIEQMNSGACDKASHLFVRYMNEMFKLGVPPCREISLCQEALRTCYAQTGNVWVCD